MSLCIDKVWLAVDGSGEIGSDTGREGGSEIGGEGGGDTGREGGSEMGGEGGGDTGREGGSELGREAGTGTSFVRFISTSGL
jgi:hypothetical protein